MNVIAYDFDLTFDLALLPPVTTPYETAGTLSGAMTVTANATTGRLRLSAFGTAALSGSGTLLKLTFNVIGAGTTTNLTWQKFALNEDTLLPASLTNGSVIVLPAATTVSAATYLGPQLAAGQIASAFGSALATNAQGAPGLPLLTTLLGTTVSVTDSAGITRLAPLFYVSPTQVNYQIPFATAPGKATVTITSGAGSTSVGLIDLVTVAPGLFSATSDGKGYAAAQVQRVTTDNKQTIEEIVSFDPVKGQFVPLPIDFKNGTDRLFLLLYGTGLRNRSALSAVSAQIGGVTLPVDYAGAQGSYEGLDQVNIELPRSLSGRGEVDVVLTIDGKAANTVRIQFK
ncbi:MAG: hypothetical protein U0Y68_13050 [Blastocatellia bacterium]